LGNISPKSRNISAKLDNTSEMLSDIFPMRVRIFAGVCGRENGG